MTGWLALAYACCSVGAVAIQLAKARGAWVATTASARALAFVSGLGADRVINYEEWNWWEDSSLALNAVFDAVGTDMGVMAKVKATLRAGDNFVSICPWTGVGFEPAGHHPLRHAAAFGMHRSSSIQDDVIRCVAEGSLRIPVDEEFPFTHEGVTALFLKVAGGKSLGKNVLKIT